MRVAFSTASTRWAGMRRCAQRVAVPGSTFSRSARSARRRPRSDRSFLRSFISPDLHKLQVTSRRRKRVLVLITLANCKFLALTATKAYVN